MDNVNSTLKRRRQKRCSTGCGCGCGAIGDKETKLRARRVDGKELMGVSASKQVCVGLDFNATMNNIKRGRYELEDFLMEKRQSPSWLCKLGFHKWRDYGESVVVTWQERTQWGRAHDHALSTRAVLSRFGTHSREVFTRRKCLRCGVDLKRRLVKNLDGSLSCVGWDSISKSEFEEE